MIAVGFGLSEFRKAKANPREVLRSRQITRGLPIIGAFDNPRPAGINDLIPDCDRTNSLALSRNLEPNVTQYLV